MTERVIPRLVLVAALLAALFAAGFGGGHAHRVASAHAAIVRRCAAGSNRPVGSARVSVAAVVVYPVVAYRTPGGAPIARFGLLNVNGVPTVFGVIGEQLNASCSPGWLHVQLPMRPNGVTGWVRASHVQRVPVRTRIVVDLS